MKSNRPISLRAELNPASLSLHSTHASFFSTSSLLRCPKVLLIYRFGMLVYTLVTICLSFRGFAYSLPPRRIWMAWLTNWSYLTGTLHFFLSFCILLTSQSHQQQQADVNKTTTDDSKSEKKPTKKKKDKKNAARGGGGDSTLPLLYRLDWVCFGIACTTSCFVTLVFFVALFPRKQLDFVPPGDIITHLLNSVIMVVDLIVSDVPLRVSHYLYVLLFFLSYFVFSILHWLWDPSNNYLYKGMLDWNEPLTTLKVGATFCFVILPIIHLILFIIYRIKSSIISTTPPTPKSEH